MKPTWHSLIASGCKRDAWKHLNYFDFTALISQNVALRSATQQATSQIQMESGERSILVLEKNKFILKHQYIYNYNKYKHI